MLNLKLRDEFLGSQMPGTAIALRRKDNTGAAQRTPDFILSITYPTADVQTALRAVSTDRSKRPIVLMGDRGRGKSHIMAVMHHAVESSSQVQKGPTNGETDLARSP
jgi:predicted ATPase